MERKNVGDYSSRKALEAECDQLRARNAELERLYSNAKTSSEFFKSSLEATNAINERLEETNTKLINDFNNMVEEHGFDQFEISVLKTDIEVLVKRNAELEEQINNPKMTYCAFCGEKYDIQDREKAIELITAHVYTCEKHPVYLYSKRNAELEAEVVDIRDTENRLAVKLAESVSECEALEAAVARLRKALEEGRTI